MGVIALHVPGTSTYPFSLRILAVILLLAAAYFIYREYREYLHSRFSRRSRK